MTNPTPEDKAAVAEYLGGPGSGDEFMYFGGRGAGAEFLNGDPR